jgi:intracellular septation protein A
MEMVMETRKPPSPFVAFRQLAVDILCGWLFLAVFLITNSIYLATAAGLVTGVLQVIWMLARRQKIDPMQWMAMALVVGLGGATIWTHDPRFVVFKPSIFEGCLAAMMLRPGWMARYVPPQVGDLLPRVLMVFWGYMWSFSWFALAASNLLIERIYGLRAWAIWTNFSPMVLAAWLIGAGIVVFPPVVRRAARARGITFSRSLAV